MQIGYLTLNNFYMPKNNNHAGWKSSLAKLVKEKGKYTSDGNKIVSFATQQARRENLFKTFKEIRELGFKVQDVKNLTSKHIYALAKFYAESYQQNSLAAATIRNRFSHLRTFCNWINKKGMIKPLEHYITVPINRTSTTLTSKAWSDKGIDPLEKIEAIRKENPRIADALALQLLFGLRSKESLLIKPHLADKGYALIINHGAKGGRNRPIPIENEQQRILLNHIKSYIDLNESLVPNQESYESFRRKYYRLLEKHGISKEQGITAHGLRHQHLNAVYEEATGEKTPVHGGNLHQTNKNLDTFGRNLVSERAGHCRPEIASAYIGGTKKKVNS